MANSYCSFLLPELGNFQPNPHYYSCRLLVEIEENNAMQLCTTFL